jgi:asparagine synthetase B (glutamine-hydrolysing)
MNRTKALLKDTYRHILPEHLFTLKKASFYPPLAKWIRRECAPLVEEALAGKRINEFFDTKKLRAMFEEHKAKTRYNLHPLANVVQLHHWFETVYDA